MKIFLTLLFLLVNINFNLKQPGPKEYVEFENVGPETKYMPPVFVSKQKLNINLQEPYLTIYRAWQKDSPGLTKEDYIKLHFEFFITDENTYSTMLSFITTHTDFYSRFPYDRYPEGNLEITANAKKYNLSYKTQEQFLSLLINNLKANNGDYKIIERLIHMR